MLNDIFKEVSKELNIPEEVIAKAYRSFWGFIRHTIEELPLKEDLSREQFDTLRTNFNIPSLGKLHCNYERMLGVQERFKYANKIRENGRVQDTND